MIKKKYKIMLFSNKKNQIYFKYIIIYKINQLKIIYILKKININPTTGSAITNILQLYYD